MSGRSTWRAPIALALLSLLGLVAGLLGDGPWDWASWLGLGLPVATCAWCGLDPRRPSRDDKATRATSERSLPTIRR